MDMILFFSEGDLSKIKVFMVFIVFGEVIKWIY